MEALGVSKYKIDRFLKDIEEDSELLNLQISIVVDTSGEIRAQGFNNLVTKNYDCIIWSRASSINYYMKC